ncbi:MAG: LytTR family transcriptional regulator DNA-binding domain-containing protein [Lachnospiraceae bacterium]|nr:LytTR family transcriptional regulator DNA-binding domain-containing protein [Lachnospiraceae bacterium]
MITIAFCFSTDTDLTYMKNELTQCFGRRGVSVNVHCCHDAHELIRCASRCLPDILFFEPTDGKDMVRRAAIHIKKRQPNLVSVAVAGKQYAAIPEDVLLKPLYFMPNKSRRQLWAYASLAYEAAINDEDSFTYYRRPGYIRMPVHGIRYFTSDGRRTHIISDEGSDTFYKKLDDVEHAIRDKGCRFLRIHKSYLVNMSYISGCSRRYVTLTSGERLSISKYEYYRQVVELLKSAPTH